MNRNRNMRNEQGKGIKESTKIITKDKGDIFFVFGREERGDGGGHVDFI